MRPGLDKSNSKDSIDSLLKSFGLNNSPINEVIDALRINKGQDSYSSTSRVPMNVRNNNIQQTPTLMFKDKNLHQKKIKSNRRVTSTTIDPNKMTTFSPDMKDLPGVERGDKGSKITLVLAIIAVLMIIGMVLASNLL